MNEDFGSLRRAGVDSTFWSSTAYVLDEATYYFGFYSPLMWPSHNDPRWFGFTVRRDSEEKIKTSPNLLYI